MRIDTEDNNKLYNFSELKVGTPFYCYNTLAKNLYMKTESAYRGAEKIINAVRISDGIFQLFLEYEKVKIAKIHVEDDKEQ